MPAALAPEKGMCSRDSAMFLLQVKTKVNSTLNHRARLFSVGTPTADTELIVLLSVGGILVFCIILLLVFCSAKSSADHALQAAHLRSPYRVHHNPWPRDATGHTPVNIEQIPPDTMPLTPDHVQPHGPPTLTQLSAAEKQLGPVLGPMLLTGRSQAKQACSAPDPMQTQFGQMLSTGNQQLRQVCRPC